MKFSIVTPSYRNGAWLKLCIASVADQANVDCEHLVQDACSDDGTQDWLPHDARVSAVVERDAGMYDAVNRGFRRATGDIVAYLNCDEQYLPGALRRVHDFFAAHPEVDVVLPDTVVVHPDGSYLCHRYSMVPLRHHLWLRFNVSTSSLFLRRRVLEEHELYFDPQWKALGDLFWIQAAVGRGLRFAELRAFASAFTETGENLGLQPVAARERARKIALTPRWIKAAAPLLVAAHRWRMLARGAFTQRPFEYAIYTLASPEQRVTFDVSKPTGLWPKRS